MTDKLPQEQPPTDDQPLSEWLSRMVILINGTLDSIFNLDQQNVLPSRPQDGQIVFFGSPVLPEIEYPGPWFYNDGHWNPLIAMYHNGPYINGRTYFPQDVVTGEGWATAAKVKTTEYPFPIETAPAEIIPDPTPTWATNSFTGQVRSGMDIIFNEGGKYGGLSVWVPEVTPTYTFSILIIDITDPANPIAQILDNRTLIAAQWNIIVLSDSLIPAGSRFLLLQQSFNSADVVTWQYPWTFAGDSNAGAPGPGDCNKRNINDILRINKDDGDAVNHNLELQVIVGTVFTITDLSDPAVFFEFRVEAPYTDNGTYYTYDVILLDIGGDGPAPGTACQIRAEQPIFDPTDYVREAAYWPTNQPTWGTIAGYLAHDGVDQLATNDVFGVRVSFTTMDISDKWLPISYAPDSGSTSAQIEEAILSSTVGNVSQLVAFSLVNQLPVGLDVPLQVNFGPAEVTDSLDLAANGDITCIEEGFYDINTIMSLGRDNSANKASLVVHVEINGVPTETSQVATLDRSIDRLPITIPAPYFLNQGDIINWFVTRDSIGADDGGLYSFVPAVVGTPTSPSAWISITKREMLV